MIRRSGEDTHVAAIADSSSSPSAGTASSSEGTAQNQFRRMRQRSNRSRTHYFRPDPSALAVALMIASDVIVALVVASTPRRPCFWMIFRGVSSHRGIVLLLFVPHDLDVFQAAALHRDLDLQFAGVRRRGAAVLAVGDPFQVQFVKHADGLDVGPRAFLGALDALDFALVAARFDFQDLLVVPDRLLELALDAAGVAGVKYAKSA